MARNTNNVSENGMLDASKQAYDVDQVKAKNDSVSLVQVGSKFKFDGKPYIVTHVEDNQKNGFQGVTYQPWNPNTGEIYNDSAIIGFAGTYPKDVKDWTADTVEVAMSTPLPDGQTRSALDYAVAERKRLKDANITLTGHSLGGHHVQYVGAVMQLPTYSFSGPSPYNQLTKEQRAYADTVGQMTIKNFYHGTDFIPRGGSSHPTGKQIHSGYTGSWFSYFFGHNVEAFKANDFNNMERYSGSRGSLSSFFYEHGILGLRTMVMAKFPAIGGLVIAKSFLSDKINELFLGKTSIDGSHRTELKPQVLQSTLSTLEEVKQNLEGIKKSNNNIFDDMEKAYRNAVDNARNLPFITESDVYDAVNGLRLKPEQRVDQGAIVADNNLVNKQLDRTDKLKKYLMKSGEHIIEDDQSFSKKFAEMRH